jgi:glycosyl transferase family 25
MIRALVLNLAQETGRLAVQKAQLAALGLPWERIEATTPVTLARPPDDPYWARWQRPLRDTEKAVFESHRRAWEKVVALGDPCLILEDDALLAAGVPDLLAAVEGRDDIDHLSLETRGRRKLLAAPHTDLPIRRLYLDRTGAAAYVLWPSGARYLLARTARAPALADGAICSAFGMRSFQADPALAIQIDQCARHGIPAPITVNSTIDAQPKPHSRRGFSLWQRTAFRARRIWAQIRMGLRQLRFLGRARREIVAPAAHWSGHVPASEIENYRRPG